MLKFFKKFSTAASKTTKSLFQNLSGIFSSNKLDDETISNIEKTLYAADFGVTTTQEIINKIKEEHKKDKTELSVSELAANVIKQALQGAECEIPQSNGSTQVICLIGINGSGKTTTAAKIANYYTDQNCSALFAACDTYRAAANEQIKIWADRLNIDIVNGQPGGDSAAVAYDAYQSARAKKRDFLIIDTAGRLHTKINLMQELRKISKTLKKIDENIVLHNWLILDGNIGTNSLEVAKTFNDEIGLNGLIITKLDGSSRGGAIVSIYRELHIPILFLGTGEQPQDLLRFSIENYTKMLF